MGDRRDGYAGARIGAGAEPARFARAARARGDSLDPVHLPLARRRARPGRPGESRDHADYRTLAHVRHRAYAGSRRAWSADGPRIAPRGGIEMKRAFGI